MPDLPNPTPASVAVWLKGCVSRDSLHNSGWIEANQRFHGITRAARTFILNNYRTPAEQAAAFEGLVLGLNALGHFSDIDLLSTRLAHSARAVARRRLPPF